jgi:CheY-like chemotaxis protein
MLKIDLIKLYATKNALVIDDFADMRGSVRRMILKFGVTDVDMASNGEDAIACCEKKNYDLILCDYNLGDSKNGQQILEELRYKKLLKRTSIYMMVTAEATSDMVFGALEYMPDEYLTKPFTEPVLGKRLDRLVLEKKALVGINTAIDKEDYSKAAALCLEHIDTEGRYQNRCRRILSECYFKQQDFEKSLAVYEGVLDQRSQEWAQIGRGKCLIELGRIDEAAEIFTTLIQERCLCLEIYDCMAEIEILQGDSDRAQSLLEEAIKISPNALLRQQRIAEISEDNHDWELSKKARKKVIKLGAYSVYESPDQHFNLARCMSEEIVHSKKELPKQLQEIEKVLAVAKKKFRTQRGVDLQADVIEAVAYADSGKVEESKEKMNDIQGKLMGKLNQPVSMSLDVARAHKAVGDHDKAQKILKELAEKYGEDAGIADAIDRLSDEPLTPKGKQKAVELNKRGKELFDAKEFQKAIQLFSQAIKHSPNNIGLNLNLMLGLIKEMQSAEANEALLERCDTAINAISHIEAGHPLYERYDNLCKHYQKLAGS